MSAGLLCVGLGFLIGSVPMAWLVVRLLAKQDVSQAGSGNVGALNASRVAKSHGVGVAVMALDIGKGALAAWLATRVFPAELSDSWRATAGAVGAIAGHNFNPWLSLARRAWTGGKGFAAAAGGALVLAPWLVAIWLGVGVAAWFVFRRLRSIRDEAPASLVATLSLIPSGWWFVGLAGAAFGVGLLVLAAPRLLPEVRAVWRAAPSRNR